MRRPRLTIINGGKAVMPAKRKAMSDDIEIEIHERGEPRITPRAGLTVAEVDAFHAARKADALKIDPANCMAIRTYCQVIDPYGVLALPEEADCIGSYFFVRNLPDGEWVWEGDLPDDILKEVVRIKQAEPEDTFPF